MARPPSSIELERLTADAARGNARAAVRLLEECLIMLRPKAIELLVATPQLRRHLDADDLVQDVCVRTLPRLNQIEPAAIWSYVNRTLVRRLVRCSRRARFLPTSSLATHSFRYPDRDPVDSSPSPYSRAAAADLVRTLIRALDGALDRRETRVLILRYCDGQSHAAVASILGLSRRESRSLCERARRKAHHVATRLEHARFLS